MENRIKELQEFKNSPPKIENTKPDDQILKDTKNEVIHNRDFPIEINDFADAHNGFVEATSHVLIMFQNSKTLDIDSITKEMVLKICLFYSTKIKDGLVFDDSYKTEFLKSFKNDLYKNKISMHCAENQNSWCTCYLKFAIAGMLECFSESLFYFIKFIDSCKLNDNKIIFDIYSSLINKKNKNT